MGIDRKQLYNVSQPGSNEFIESKPTGKPPIVTLNRLRIAFLNGISNPGMSFSGFRQSNRSNRHELQLLVYLYRKKFGRRIRALLGDRAMPSKIRRRQKLRQALAQLRYRRRFQEKLARLREVGWTWRLALACITTMVGASVPVGWALGVVNTPADIIKHWCNETAIDRYDVHLSESGINVLWSAVVSILLIGGMTGSLTGALVADKIGRKGTMILGKILFLVAAVLFITSKPLKSIEFLLLGRLVSGLSSGLITAVMPMYLAEMAPMSLQGATGVLCPMGMCFGVWIAQVMGLHAILGTAENWNILLCFYAILVLPSFLALPWLCESPKYLDGVRNDRIRAIKELSKLRNLPPEIVVHELEDAKDDGPKEKWSVARVLGTRELRLNLALVCAFHGVQQLSGINAVFFYSTDIFQKAGLSNTNAQYASLLASFLNFVFAVVMMPIVNHYPRRVLSVFSASTATLWLISLTVFIANMDTIEFFSYMSVVGVLGYVLCYGVALGPIPYFLGTELFEVGPRPSAMALGSVSNWSCNFLVGMTFLAVQNAIGAYSFLIFAASTGLLTAFLYFCLPETNAKFLARRNASPN